MDDLWGNGSNETAEGLGGSVVVVVACDDDGSDVKDAEQATASDVVFVCNWSGLDSSRSKAESGWVTHVTEAKQ